MVFRVCLFHVVVAGVLVACLVKGVSKMGVYGIVLSSWDNFYNIHDS